MKWIKNKLRRVEEANVNIIREDYLVKYLVVGEGQKVIA